MTTGDPLIIFTPSGKRGRFPAGTPILQAARALGVDLDSVCGGRGICSKCQIAPAFGEFPKHGVTVSSEALSPWNKVEDRYKTKRGLIDGRRLGCQAKVRGDVVIDVPEESQVHRQVVRKEADAREIPMDPCTRLFYVEVAEPDMQTPKGDMERLTDALRERWQLDDIAADPRILRTLQAKLREGGWKVTAAIHTGHDEDTRGGGAGGRIVHVWPGFYEGTIYGVAFDVGSTTIACHLCDLITGDVVVSAGRMNPQIRFGEDLMSRVSYSMMNPGGAADMTQAVREAINALIGEVANEAGIAREEIMEGVFVGNPIMHHLLLGIDPVELGWAPFALAVSDSITLRADEIGAAMHPGARIYILPCIAGHVGADAAAVALSESPHLRDETTLIVDVGTNAEIILGNKDGLTACSSPTGPAFEGAQVSAGQRAAPGAIERVRIDPKTKTPKFRIIGCDLWSDESGFRDAAGERGITGICGSGIIEAIAEMRIAGIIDENGSIGPASALGSCVAEDGRTWAYALHDGRDDGGPLVSVTQNDVRAIQLAKAALYAGARLLMDKMGIETIDRIALAGAFGAHISPLHAMVLGMIPDCPVENVVSAGNAAGTGARAALLNAASRREVEKIARTIEKIETATEEKFQDHFVEAIAVPHKTARSPNLDRAVSLPVVAFGGAKKEGTEETGRRRRRRARA